MAKDDSDRQSSPVEALSKAVGGKIDASTLKRLVKTIGGGVRIGRKGVHLSGRGLADILLATAPRIPVRSAERLSQDFDGITGSALAGQLIRNASRNSAAVGGAAGAFASLGELMPPMWITLPVEIVVETLLVATIEMKLVAELHEIYGRPISGSPESRGAAIVESWARRRGVDVSDIAKRGGLRSNAEKGARSHIISLVRRKLTARLFRNVSTLAPLLVGAVAGAEINRRATRDLGDDVVRDLT